MILCARRVRPAYPSLKTEVARCLAVVSVRNQVIGKLQRHGWCHEGTTASGNKPHCDCDAGYGGSHCETKILNLEELSIKVADIEEEMEKGLKP